MSSYTIQRNPGSFCGKSQGRFGKHGKCNFILLNLWFDAHVRYFPYLLNSLLLSQYWLPLLVETRKVEEYCEISRMKELSPSFAKSGGRLVYPIPGFCNQVCISCLKYQIQNLKTSVSILAEDNSRMVVHHNPLPDITHEDFVSLLGPLLAPENYPSTGLTDRKSVV